MKSLVVKQLNIIQGSVTNKTKASKWLILHIVFHDIELTTAACCSALTDVALFIPLNGCVLDNLKNAHPQFCIKRQKYFILADMEESQYVTVKSVQT